MDDDNVVLQERAPRLVAEHRIIALVIAASVIGLVFTVISLRLYHTEGIAQLDLSRPGYISKPDENIEFVPTSGFLATGEIDQAVLQEFVDIYTKEVDEAMTIDAYSADPMSLRELGLDESEASKANRSE